MASKKLSFDWSVLDREGLAQHFWSISNHLTKTPISVTKFHSKLAKHIKEIAPIRVRKKIDFEVTPGWVWIGGTYFSDQDKKRQKCIDLELVYNPADETLNMPVRRFNRMCYGMADTLLHEIIHMRQYRRRNFKDLPDYDSKAEKTKKRMEQSYLGCSDEIDAYGFNIACELHSRFNGDYEQIIDYLNENQKGKNRRHNSWRMYLKAFDHDHNHPIVQRVKTKVIRYLPHAEAGKPYSNKDWINR